MSAFVQDEPAKGVGVRAGTTRASLEEMHSTVIVPAVSAGNETGTDLVFKWKVEDARQHICYRLSAK
jgi:hypothetical protein